MLRLGSIVLGADDVDRAVAFWAAAFDYEVIRFPDADDDFTILVPPDRVGTRIACIGQSLQCRSGHGVHLDLVADSAAEQSSEIDRLIGLGATRVPWTTPPILTSWCWLTPRATVSASSTPATADVECFEASSGAPDTRLASRRRPVRPRRART